MAIDMIEPFGAPEIFITGIGDVEDVGAGNRRVTFFARQKFAGECSNVVAVKLIVHESHIAACMATMATLGLVTCADQPACPVKRMH